MQMCFHYANLNWYFLHFYFDRLWIKTLLEEEDNRNSSIEPVLLPRYLNSRCQMKFFCKIKTAYNWTFASVLVKLMKHPRIINDDMRTNTVRDYLNRGFIPR